MDLGSIIFDGVPYSLPQTISKPAGTYTIQAVPPSGYVFKQWDAITPVDSRTSPKTTITISGARVIVEMELRKEPVAAAEFFHFDVSVSPGYSSVNAGETTSFSVPVTLTSGTSQSVSLGLSGLPSNVGSYNFSPSSGKPTFTSTLTISTYSSAPSGSYDLVISGSGGGETKTAFATLIIKSGPSPPPPPTLQPLSLSSTSSSPSSLYPGESFTGYYTIYNPNSVYVTAGLGMSIRPSGTYGEIVDTSNDITVSVSPGSNTYSRNFRVPSSASTGSYDIAMAIWDGYPGSGSQIASSGWKSGPTILPKPQPFDFSIYLSDRSKTITAGERAVTTVTVRLENGSPQAVSLSCSGLPSSEGRCLLDGSTSRIVTPTQSATLSIETGTSTSSRQYSITITGSGGGLTRTDSFILYVEAIPPPPPPQPTPVTPPTPQEVKIRLRSDADDGRTDIGSIVFDGRTYSLPTTIYKPAGTYSIQASPAKDYVFKQWDSISPVSSRTSPSTTVTVSGTSVIVEMELRSEPEIGSFHFALSASPNSKTIEQGGRTTISVPVTHTSGPSERVTLSLSGLPSYIGTYDFSPSYGTSSFTSTLYIDVKPSASPGTYSLTIKASGGGETHEKSVNLRILTLEQKDYPPPIEEDDLGSDSPTSTPDTEGSTSFGRIAVEKESYTLKRHDSEQVNIIGSIENYQRGKYVEVILTKPGGETESMSFLPTKDGVVRGYYRLVYESEVGTYSISASYNGKKIGSTSFDVVREKQSVDTEPKIEQDVIEPKIIEPEEHLKLVSDRTNELKAEVWEYKVKVLESYIKIFRDPNAVSNRIVSEIRNEGQDLVGLASAILGGPSDQILFLVEKPLNSFNLLIESRTHIEKMRLLAANDNKLVTVIDSLENLKQTSQEIATAYRQNNLQYAERLETGVPAKVSRAVSSLDSFMEFIINKDQTFTESEEWQPTKKVSRDTEIERTFAIKNSLNMIEVNVKQKDKPSVLFGIFGLPQYTIGWYQTDELFGRKGDILNTKASENGASGWVLTPNIQSIKPVIIYVKPQSFGSTGLFWSPPITETELDISVKFTYNYFDLDKELVKTGFRNINSEIKQVLGLF